MLPTSVGSVCLLTRITLFHWGPYMFCQLLVSILNGQNAMEHEKEWSDLIYAILLHSCKRKTSSLSICNTFKCVAVIRYDKNKLVLLDD